MYAHVCVCGGGGGGGGVDNKPSHFNLKKITGTLIFKSNEVPLKFIGSPIGALA